MSLTYNYETSWAVRGIRTTRNDLFSLRNVAKIGTLGRMSRAPLKRGIF
jgi:hypothetical protein